MRKLVLKMSISADGFVGGPKGEIDWLLRTMDESALAWIQDTLWEAGLHIMGSRTFHDMASYWPTSSDPIAAPMNEIPKAVFSRKRAIDPTSIELTTQAIKDKTRMDSERGVHQLGVEPPAAASWKNVPVLGDLATEIGKLKQQAGKPILAHGGASFARSLVELNLVDEYRLLIHPVVLGKGLPLFSTIKNPIDFVLQSSTVLRTGIVANVYRPSSSRA